MVFLVSMRLCNIIGFSKFEKIPAVSRKPTVQFFFVWDNIVTSDSECCPQCHHREPSNQVSHLEGVTGDRKLVCDRPFAPLLCSGYYVKDRFYCFSMQVIMNKCFLLNAEKIVADPSCCFREKRNKAPLILKNYLLFTSVYQGFVDFY